MTLDKDTSAADPDAYQRLLDIAALADAREGIRQGLEDVRQGRTRPVREFVDEFEAQHGISRGRKDALRILEKMEDADYEGHSLSMLQRIAAALQQRLEIRFVPRTMV